MPHHHCPRCLFDTAHAMNLASCFPAVATVTTKTTEMTLYVDKEGIVHRVTETTRVAEFVANTNAGYG